MTRLWDFIPEVDLQALFLKLPRPERSGALSVVLHYALVFMLLTAGAAADPDIRCWLHPESCTQPETNADVRRDYNITPLLPCSYGNKKCVKANRYCTCKIWQGDFQHVWFVFNELCGPDMRISYDADGSVYVDLADGFTIAFPPAENNKVSWACNDEGQP